MQTRQSNRSHETVNTQSPKRPVQTPVLRGICWGVAGLLLSTSACASIPASSEANASSHAASSDTNASTTPVAGSDTNTSTANAAPVAATVISTNTVGNVDSKSALPLPLGSQRYRFAWDGQLEGTATRTLSCQQTLCTLRTEASVPGLATLTEVSRFQWQQNQVHFEDYQRNLQLLFFPQNVHISRNADGQIHSERKGRSSSYADQPDLIDSLSLEAQLRADLVRGGKLKTTYKMAEVKGPLEVSISELAHDTLSIDGKKIATRVFQRRNADGSRETTFWLDPAQAFLPVQVIHRDGAETYRLTWIGAGS